MSRSEVYSWRLSRETRELLEAAAREEGVSVARILERIATEWLDRRRERDGEDRQAVLREAVASCFGSLAGGDPGRSRGVREDLREKLTEVLTVDDDFLVYRIEGRRRFRVLPERGPDAGRRPRREGKAP